MLGIRNVVSVGLPAVSEGAVVAVVAPAARASDLFDPVNAQMEKDAKAGCEQRPNRISTTSRCTRRSS